MRGISKLLLFFLAELLLVSAEGKPIRYKCQYLRSHNRTGLVCTPIFDATSEITGPRPRSFTAPETFNGNTIRHRESACANLLRLAEKMKSFEGGAWKYCDPATCLRESPHCSNNVVSDKCRLCFGRCWLMYGFPDVPEKAQESMPRKSFPCDPSLCGIHVFCGGYKFVDGDDQEPPKLVV
ncbi:uncharacterized protein LOC135393143 [Ornithodoros turicata]|uniref:uncharacterized protein LOC135393143 n=1 Tax=Ornithodoros turicata TaxID=34597 RepID=UPI0031397003